MLSETIDQTYPHLSAALDGVARFSDTIGKRDDQIKQLLANANKIAGILGNRSAQVNQLLVNAQSLLAAINERNYAVSMLLERVGSFSDQVKGFIDDNPNLNHVLEQLRTVSDVLRDRRFDLMQTLTTVAKFVASLGEAVASGPYFKVMLVNLLPGQILQPFVDSAFKKRGIDPEKFWGDAGLPACQFPDPNGQRFAERRAGAATRDPGGHARSIPGRRVLQGLAVLLHATARPSAAPWRPAAVFALDDRSVRRPRIRPARRRHLGRRTRMVRLHAGSARARPSRVSCRRICPAYPVPLPPAPPGARTVPLGPLPAPPDFTPGIAPLPPALTGPPPPPGPGPDAGPAGAPPLPGNPPYLPPGSQEG